MTKTPAIWMEARCGSVASITSPNWVMPEACHQTSDDGGFFTNMRAARKHFLSCEWEIIDGEWWCPFCAAQMKEK